MRTRAQIGLDWKNDAERHSSFQLVGQDGRWVANVDMAQFSGEAEPRIRRLTISPTWEASRKKNPRPSLIRWALKMHKKNKPVAV
jgi:hypothetical protein